MSQLECSDFPVRDLQPRTETGVTSFINKYPDYDGRGVVIAILDTGVDPGAGGLQLTTDGNTKVISRIDCSGAGDVEMTICDLTEGYLIGMTGRKLVIPHEWSNPSGIWRVGVKRAFDLYPQSVRSTVIKKRYNEWIIGHNKSYSELLTKQQEHKKTMNLKPKQETEPISENMEKLIDDDLDASIEALITLDKQFSGNRSPSSSSSSCTNGDSGDLGPVWDCILYHDSTHWNAVIDISEVGDLSKALVLRPYSETYDFAFTNSEEAFSVSINVYDGGNTLQIVGCSGAHGTHVASIAAANFPNEPEKNGVAPGCQIVSLCIGDQRLSTMESCSSIIRAMTYIMQQHEDPNGIKIDVINMSFGELGAWSNGGCIGRLIDEVINDYGVIWVTSAGNKGPALSTVGCPADTFTSEMISVGAYVSPQMMNAMYASREMLPAGPYTWTSRGPSLEGHRGVTVCAPGAAITSVPTYALQCTRLMNGTSMASPHVCGAVALILSGIRQKNISHVSPNALKRAIEETALFLPHQCQYAQGHGLLQVEAAFEVVLKSINSVCHDVRFLIECHAGRLDASKGIYIRGENSTKPHDIIIKVTPSFLKDKSVNSSRKINFNLKLCLTCNASWVQHPRHLDLPYSARVFNIWVDPRGLSPGIHSAYIKAFDTNQSFGPLWEVPIHIVRCEDLTEFYPRPKMVRQRETFQPGQIRRHFLIVPQDATWAVFSASICTDATIDHSVEKSEISKFYLHATIAMPRMIISSLQSKQFFSLKCDKHFEIGFQVKGEYVLELCLAKWWSCIGSVPIKYSVTFYGVSCNFGNEEIFMQHCQGIKRFEISGLGFEEALPEIKLKNSVLVLHPSESEIVVLGERDVLPRDNSSVFELQLSYTFSVTNGGGKNSKTEIIPNLTFLSDLLYESELESQMWMLYYSTRRQLVACGDATPTKWAIKVEKGEYTLKARIRSRHRQLLEKTYLSDLVCCISFRLPTPINLDIYSTYGAAQTSDKSLRVTNAINIFKGRILPLYIAPMLVLADSGSKKNGGNQIHGPGQNYYYTGTISLAKNEIGKKSSAFSFTYIPSQEASRKTSPKIVASTDKVSGCLWTDYRDSIMAHQASWLSKLNPTSEEAQCLYRELKEAYDDDSVAAAANLSRLQLDVAWMNSHKTEEKPKPDPNKIIEAANTVIDQISIDDVLAMVATKSDLRVGAEKFKKENDTKKSFLIEALVIRGQALLSQEDQMENLKETHRTLMKLVDPVSDTKVALFVAEYFIHLGYFGSALKIILRLLADEKSCKIELENKSIFCMEQLGFHHAAKFTRCNIPSKYPSSYLPF